MAAHQIAETARDALFLRELGPTRLPTVYLLLALIGIPIALVPARFSSSRRSLAAIMLLNAVVSLGFWWASGARLPGVYEAFYVWTGLSATVFVTFFWLLLGGRYSLTRAKAVFPKFTVGGIAGALLGATLARGITEITATRGLLLAVAALQILAAFLSMRLDRVGDLDSDRAETRRRFLPILSMFRRAARSPYARVVGVMLLLASVTLTLVDYTFKSVVAAHVAKQDLDRMFATYYAALNLLSLLSMALLARRLLLWVGLTSVVLFLPALIVTGALGVLVGGGLMAALILKGADGSLRYSLHRTSTELLFVPMRESTRSVVKPLLDIAVKPVGQALASLLILLFLQLSTRNSVYALMTTFFGVLWIASGVRLRGLYLDVFRKTLRADSVHIRTDLPELEVDSLATVVEQLNDENDGAVCGAMDVLVAHGHSSLIPDLVLYHPSPEVVTHALKLFREERRTRVRTLVRRLIDNPAPMVRAEALLFFAAIDPRFVCPPAAGRDPDPLVRGVAAALLLESSEPDFRLGRADEPDQEQFEIGFAGAIAVLPDRARRCLDPELITHASPQVQKSIAQAIARRPTEADVPLLIHLLALRHAREHARRALRDLGKPALAKLVDALRDTHTPLAVRCHIPRTISRFPAEEAAPILLDCVVSETDELVLHKALRGLGRVDASDPHVRLDRERLLDACDQLIGRTLLLVQIRATLERSRADAIGSVRTIRQALLGLLADAEERGIEHVFLALHLLHPTENMDHLFRGITSTDLKRRSTAEELLMHLVDRRLRDGLAALIANAPDEERLVIASEQYELDDLDERAALERLLETDGTVLGRAAARYLEATGEKRRFEVA
jgi:ATP/ADP translocase/HEAT repeat protein